MFANFEICIERRVTWTMEKVKKICRIILIFALAMGASILPTIMLCAEEQKNMLFRTPEYWVISAGLAAAITWKFIREIKNSKY